ncbi:TPA: hypothetical protein RTG66_001565 [Campylobacter jejuni]|nr:hypothetical protein [Campylobacter jejuni]
MTTLKLDKNNNLMFDVNLITIDKKDAIIQDIKTLLLMFKTEYPFDLKIGLDWYRIANSNNREAISRAIRERILEDERIYSIEDLNISFNNGELIIKLQLNTTDGIINV